MNKYTVISALVGAAVFAGTMAQASELTESSTTTTQTTQTTELPNAPKDAKLEVVLQPTDKNYDNIKDVYMIDGHQCRTTINALKEHVKTCSK